MICKTHNTLDCARTLWVALSSATLLVGHAGAQTAPPAVPPAATLAPYKSAFEGYRAYSDDKMTSWRAANDEVARVGGWREYARQAQQPENTPAPAHKAGTGQPKAKP